MESKHWFARKRYGWGWTPVTWQGWAVIGAYAAFLVTGALLFLPDHGTRGVIAFLVWTAGYTVWLVSLCWQHGPRPQWQWGRPSGGSSDTGSAGPE